MTLPGFVVLVIIVVVIAILFARDDSPGSYRMSTKEEYDLSQRVRKMEKEKYEAQTEKELAEWEEQKKKNKVKR